ncbi:BCCT family transporter [Gracilibacillus sp. D59]|uniref:BCCT family transporter n=1 Tax=Gracilibacillus sp. D59 TaxID=3457434 RepID=UPI003FCDDA6B
MIYTLLRCAFEKDQAWIDSWTIFFLEWWISKRLFVGISIARISEYSSKRQELVTPYSILP